MSKRKFCQCADCSNVASWSITFSDDLNDPLVVCDECNDEIVDLDRLDPCIVELKRVLPQSLRVGGLFKRSSKSR